MQSLTLNRIYASSCSYALWFNVVVGVEVHLLLRGCVVGVVGSSAWVGHRRRCVVVNIQGFVVLRKWGHGEEFVIVHLRGPKSRVVPL